jgi:hypothetical protein
VLRRASIRPHFDISLRDDGSAILAAIKAALASSEAPFVGDALTNDAYLRIPRDERSLLSPNLNLEVIEDGGETVLRGRFTPHPSVWMGFMAVFLVLTMIGLAGLMYGLAKLTVQESAWAMLAAPICAGLIAFVYGAAFVAQGLVQDEMYAMRAWLENLARSVDGS